MENKYKFVALSVFVLATVFLTMSFATAAATLNSPLANTNNSGTLTFNCTTALVRAFNASLIYDATGAAAGTVLTTITNTSTNQTEFANAAVDISGLTDGSTYNMSCYADNGTDQEYASATGITVDNTDPTVTVSSAKKYVDYMTSVSVTGSCSDAIDSSVTTTRTLSKGNTGNTVSVSSSPYTLSGGDLNVLGTNTYTVTCTDDSGNSATSSTTFVIQTDEDLVEDDVVDEVKEKKMSTGILVAIITLVIAIIVGIAFVVFKLA